MNQSLNNIDTNLIGTSNNLRVIAKGLDSPSYDMFADILYQIAIVLHKIDNTYGDNKEGVVAINNFLKYMKEVSLKE